MLDSFMIIRANGVPVWDRTNAPVNRDLVNSWIKDVFIDEKTEYAGARAGNSSARNPPYRKGKQTLKYVCVKEGHLNFVAVYQSIIHLAWLDQLIDNIRTLFISLYGDQLTKPNTTRIECDKFDEYFDQQMRELEGTSSGTSTRTKPSIDTPDESRHEASAPTDEELGDEPPPEAPGLSYKGRAIKVAAQEGQGPSADSTPVITPTTSRSSTPGGSNLVVGKPGRNKLSRRARKVQNAAASSAPASSGDEGPSARRGGKGAAGKGVASSKKKGRKWDDHGMADEEDDDLQLDYSASAAAAKTSGDSDADPPASRSLEQVDKSTWGSTTSKGQFVLKDLGDEVHSILASAQSKDGAGTNTNKGESAGFIGSGFNTISGLFKNVVGGKTLTKDDTEKAMKGMLDHLLQKNVAHEAAQRLCQEVENALIGQKTGSFESISTVVHSATESALTKMLTPTNSLDLLRDVEAITTGAANKQLPPRPYVISIVGVNGVGKSTNLSKMCYFLLQNKKRVLVAAGDTFRSGAVEQLGVHVRNLKEMTEREGGAVELYQRGYGKDAAQVARDAVAHAAAEGFDVVLIDTAGRRHNDQRLMSSLEKFANFAKPDKILMVGEALVGTDSVAQARNFNAAFGSARNLDGFIISKCDTVGGMVGTLVSLVHATNVPILFVGVGQHYSDLRNFSVKWAVEKLLAE